MNPGRTTDLEQALALLHTRPELAESLLVMAGVRQAQDQPGDGKPEVQRIMRHTMLGKEQEHFMIFAVDLSGRIIDHEVLFKGSDMMVATAPKIIFRWLLTREQVPHKWFVAHNHPSADSRPSQPDIDMTDALLRGASYIGLMMEDHFILGEGGDITSIRDHVRRYGNVEKHRFGRQNPADDIIKRLRELIK